MTDDLVKRLRAMSVGEITDPGDGGWVETEDAADFIETQDKRIKELEAALQEIEMLHYDSETDFHHDAMKANHIARAALAGEKKE